MLGSMQGALNKELESGCGLSRVSVVCPRWWSLGDPLVPTTEEAAVEMKESIGQAE